MALEATRPALLHLPEEALENYAFGRLPETQLASCEEHLLGCEHCQQRLDAEDFFAGMIGSLIETAHLVEIGATPATAQNATEAPVSNHVSDHVSNTVTNPVTKQAPNQRWISYDQASWAAKFPAWHRTLWRAPFGGLALAGFLAVGLGIATWKSPFAQSFPFVHGPISVETVTLKTLRGGSPDGMAQARAGRPLELTFDLGETAKAVAGPYRLEMVEAAGEQAWTGSSLASETGAVKVRVQKHLPPGVYWIRVYAKLR